MEWMSLIAIALESIFSIIVNPLFWIVLLLIHSQYRKVSRMEKRLIGEEKATPIERVISSLGVGILGGILGTILISILGVTVQLEDFRFILPLAILLMLVNVRYLCFSYAGGLISLSSLLFGYPHINVSSIIAIVAVLHFIESVLIWIDGHKYPTPIFVNHDIYGTVGAFTLQRFWPIPFAVLIIFLGKLKGATDINLPDWWPLFINNGLDLENITLQMTVVVAALGYGDIAISSTPREKSKKSSFRLAIYSIALLILSVISTYIYSFKYIAALFAPLAHEGLILFSQREENNRRPIYKVNSYGITVLDVKRDSVAEKMGIKAGYVIRSINNFLVNDKEDLAYFLRQYPTYIWVDAINEKGEGVTLEYSDYQKGISTLGAIIVPRYSDVIVSPHRNISILKGLFDKFKNKIN